jgi:aspartate ammonia-lyase
VRVERDSLGPVDVPDGVLWGAHTARALESFAGCGVKLAERPDLLVALAETKVAAARANARLGVLEPDVAEAIVAAGREVAAGRWHDEFPLDVVQGGGGTATNLNADEVLANRAEEILGGARGAYELVHPLDHVNRSQSTNDVYPTALQVATIRAGARAVAALEHVRETLVAKAAEEKGRERLGRTCLQDALPVPLAAGLTAAASGLGRTAAGIGIALAPLRRVPLGATAVGTGAGAPEGYRELAVELLAEETGLPLEPSEDPFDALANLDPYAAVASALARAFLVLGKLAADLRFLSSGPVGGIGEVRLPPVLVGSSCMPGKVNPVLPELVLQVGFEVRGAAHTVELAVAAGELELNVMEPVIASHLLGALEVAGHTAHVFADRCLAGLDWDDDAVQRHLGGSRAASVTRLADVGYDAAGSAADV